MLEKLFHNADLDIELTSYIDDKQNVWFRGKDVAKILGYSVTDQAIRKHVSDNHKQLICCPVEMKGQQNDMRGKWTTFIHEAGFYELVFSSKLPAAKKFRDWVFEKVPPSICKYGQYKLFDNARNKMIMISNETDLHYKVVDMIRRFYPDSILVAGLGELQDTEDKRLDSYKKGYMKGQPDLTILKSYKDFMGLGIEFKPPTGNYRVSDAQKEMKKRYFNNGYAFILFND